MQRKYRFVANASLVGEDVPVIVTVKAGRRDAARRKAERGEHEWLETAFLQCPVRVQRLLSVEAS